MIDASTNFDEATSHDSSPDRRADEAELHIREIWEQGVKVHPIELETRYDRSPDRDADEE